MTGNHVVQGVTQGMPHAPLPMPAALDGAPIFAILSLVIALSVYLRTVHNDAGNRLEDIMVDIKHNRWPGELPATEKMLEHLESIRRRIENVTKFLFGFIAFLIFRAAYYVYSFIPPGIFPFRALLPLALNIFDLMIVILLGGGMFFMWRQHRTLVTSERSLRLQMITFHKAHRLEQVATRNMRSPSDES